MSTSKLLGRPLRLWLAALAVASVATGLVMFGQSGAPLARLAMKSIIGKHISAPGTPPAGFSEAYFDSSGCLAYKKPGGSIVTLCSSNSSSGQGSLIDKRTSMAMPASGSFTGWGNYWDTGVNGCAGVFFQGADGFSPFFRANYQSGGTANVACGRNTINGNSAFAFPGNRPLLMNWTLNVTNATNYQMYLVAFNGSCCGDWDAGPPTGVKKWFGIRVSTTTSPTGAYCTAGDGSSATFTNMASGLGVDTALHQFKILYDPSVPSVTCSFDGGNETTVTTNVPTDDVQFTAAHIIVPTTNAARNMLIQQVYMEENWQ